MQERLKPICVLGGGRHLLDGGVVNVQLKGDVVAGAVDAAHDVQRVVRRVRPEWHADVSALQHAQSDEPGELPAASPRGQLPCMRASGHMQSAGTRFGGPGSKVCTDGGRRDRVDPDWSQQRMDSGSVCADLKFIFSV